MTIGRWWWMFILRRETECRSTPSRVSMKGESAPLLAFLTAAAIPQPTTSGARDSVTMWCAICGPNALNL